MEIALILGSAVLVIAVVVADRLGWVELEMNPFSAASRAGRAQRAGRIGEALRLYARAGKRERVRACLEAAVPDRAVRASLINAADQLLDLAVKINAPVVRAAVPEALTLRLRDQTDSAGEAVWSSAGRIAAAVTLGSGRAGLPSGVYRETAKLDLLLEAIHGAQDELADLATSGGAGAVGLAQIEQSFRRLGDAAHNLREALDVDEIGRSDG